MNEHTNRKLDFFILGAQKAGSSWLANRLRTHDQLFMPKDELYFFDVQRNYERGINWYLSHFRGAQPHQLLGEKTPSMYVVRGDQSVQPIPRRLADHNPDLQFFVVLRNPIQRTQSALLHHIWNGRLPANASPFDLLFGEHADKARNFGILEQGLYYKQLTPFLDIFPIERFRFYIFERDVMLSPEATLADAEAFLGVEQGGCDTGGHQQKRNRSIQSKAALRWNARIPSLSYLWQIYDRLNPNGEKFCLDQNIKHELYNFFYHDIRQLENRLGVDLYHWGPDPRIDNPSPQTGAHDVNGSTQSDSAEYG